MIINEILDPVGFTTLRVFNVCIFLLIFGLVLLRESDPAGAISSFCKLVTCANM